MYCMFINNMYWYRQTYLWLHSMPLPLLQTWQSMSSPFPTIILSFEWMPWMDHSSLSPFQSFQHLLRQRFHCRRLKLWEIKFSIKPCQQWPTTSQQFIDCIPASMAFYHNNTDTLISTIKHCIQSLAVYNRCSDNCINKLRIVCTIYISNNWANTISDTQSNSSSIKRAK